MIRKLPWLMIVMAGWLGLTQAQPRGRVAPPAVATLRVLLPEDDALFTIDDAPTRQAGTLRVFASPPLDPRRTYAYTLTATWEPNNYTKVIRTRIVNVR